MRVIRAFPPGYAEMKKRFPVSGRGIIFSYGDTLFNPGGIVIPPWLLAHEEAHGLRQRDPAAWWERYFVDLEFRLAEEVIGHRAEHKCFREIFPSPKKREHHKQDCAKRLSSPLYGSMVSYAGALRLMT